MVVLNTGTSTVIDLEQDAEGKRLTKSQGSCKTGKSCIAHMKVMQDIATGQVIVEYCPTHNSHSVELAHLPVPTDIKHKVAAKLHDTK